ncbi:5649_t:CDS:2, partial [Funneliformis mosseae]
MKDWGMLSVPRARFNQTQYEEVKRFWLDIEIEKSEIQMKQTEVYNNYLCQIPK